MKSSGKYFDLGTLLVRVNIDTLVLAEAWSDNWTDKERSKQFIRT